MTPRLSPGPQPDPNADQVRTQRFKEAERLAREHGLGYLSITGVCKLADVIEAVRAAPRKVKRAQQEQVA